MSEGPTLWVIIRDTGEYADRWREPIRYVTSEEEAKAACVRAMEERNEEPAGLPDYPRPGLPEDERAAQVRAWQGARIALGFVDPDGPLSYAEYDYGPVSPVPHKQA